MIPLARHQLLTFALLPGVNHVLKPATGTTPAEQMTACTDASLPLGPEVVPTISKVILALRPKP